MALQCIILLDGILTTSLSPAPSHQLLKAKGASSLLFKVSLCAKMKTGGAGEEMGAQRKQSETNVCN